MKATILVDDHHDALKTLESFRKLAKHEVVATPHLGYLSRDAYEPRFTDIFDSTVTYDRGAPVHVVRHDVLESSPLRDA